MASAKDLRKRISSVKNTQQITKAMKMVSAAKLRRAQDNIFALRPYAREMTSIMQSLVESLGDELNHPLLSKKSDLGVAKKTCLVVVVSSDRGLCGGFNSSVIKYAQKVLKQDQAKYEKIDFAFIGKKGFEFFKTKKSGKYYQGFFAGLNYQKAADLSKELIELYLSGEYAEIKFIYNEFKSAISQQVNFETLLPIQAPAKKEEISNSIPMVLFEPKAEEILDTLLPKYFAVQVFKIVLESLASEHGARMAAMENATKNAGEMIKKITLLYNKTRQAAITKELLEIVSGTEAQKA